VISREAKRLKHPSIDACTALDPVTTVLDILSVAVLAFIVVVGYRAVRAFKQSKQAVTESASILGVVVSALSSRVQASESLVADLRRGFDTITHRSAELEGEQSDLRGNYLHVLGYLQEILSNDKRLILELEQLKTNLTPLQQKQTPVEDTPRHRQGPALPIGTVNILASLTPTERHTLEIIAREGPKAAPELGRRIRKSREHMARLMKKLYLDGYVDRESNRAPFRYKLNEKIASLLGSGEQSATVEASEKA
jgi:hypothetical protein